MDMNETTELPKYINVMKVVTYDVYEVIKDIKTLNSDIDGDMDITLEDVVEHIENLAKMDDFSCGWGHQTDISDLIFTDENGEEL
jgi:hypothetical protein